MQGSHSADQSFRAVAFESLEARRLLSSTLATSASLVAPASYTWGVYPKMLGLDQLTAKYPKLTGAGESIAIIDSGVDYKNPALGGAWGNKVIAGYDFENNTSDPFTYTNAHGTAVAGVAAATPYYVDGVRYQGIAPGADLIALEEDNGYQIKSALDWVIAHKTQYNIVAANITDWSGPWQAYMPEVKTLTQMGVFISSPAGNGGAGTSVGVNTTGNLFAIGGVDQSGGLWSGSSRGKNLLLAAPAGDVMIPYYQTNDGKQVYYNEGSGTSWAAPNAAGAAALLKEIDPKWTPTQIMSIFQQSADKVYDGASKLTYDRLNVYHAVQLAYSLVGQTAAPAPKPASTPVAAPVAAPKKTPVVDPAPTKPTAAPTTPAPHLRGRHHSGHHHAGNHSVAVAAPPAAPKPSSKTSITASLSPFGLTPISGMMWAF